MPPTDRELMQQALEALEWNLPVIEDYGDHEQLNRQHRAIIALRERLAQPEQEPVAWRWRERINSDFDSWVISASEPPPYSIEQQPLYTTPPQRKPLTKQDPVAWYCKEGLNRGVSLKQESPEWEPLYTISQHRRPLSDDEADEFVRRFSRYELIRAIEAAHGIKGEA